jgi:hypothetical protein
VADWPEEWRYAYEERAGIQEFTGGLSRAEAERQAEACVRLEYARTVEMPPENQASTVTTQVASPSRVGEPGGARTGVPVRGPGVPEGEEAPSGA